MLPLHHYQDTLQVCISGRNCSLAKMNLSGSVSKVLTSAAAINGQDKAQRGTVSRACRETEGRRHRTETENWVMCNNQNWVLEMQVSHRAGNVYFKREKEL